MRVLIFAPTVNRGGGHLVAERLTAALAEYAPSEWSFAVLGQRYDEFGISIRWPEDWPFEQIDPVEKLPPHPEQFSFLARHADTFAAHLRRVQDDYDLIYLLTPWWVIRAAEWGITKPVVTTVADFAFDYLSMGRVLETHFKAGAQLLHERCATVVFSSDWQRQHGVRHYQLDNTQVIPYSADFVATPERPTSEDVERVRLTYNLPERYVLAFHCYGHKGIQDILKAQHTARLRSADVPPLVIAGLETEHYLARRPPNGHVADVQRLMRGLGARNGDNIFILGEIAERDIAPLHAGAMVAVQASKSEGDVAAASLYAMLARTPLIHSDLPVYLERLGEDQRLALTFPVGKSRPLALALIDACENRQQAARRAARAYRWATSRTSKDVAREYLDVFERALNRGDAA